MKYVFFDIDGTIRGKSREITKRNREAICKLRENGHKAFLCTGRAPVSITQDILDVGFDGVISAAGSFIQIDGKYIYENFDVFKLIFCHSAGTEYEYYFDELAEIEEKYYREFVKQFSRRENMVSDFFIHVICRTGWSYIYEVVSHDLSYDEAQIFMKSIREFCFAGWGKVLGQNYEDLGL